MITAVDTNVLLDILDNDPLFFGKSCEWIERQRESGSLIISPVVYSELLAYFLNKHELVQASFKLEEFLKDSGIVVFGFAKEDLTLSAFAWRKFPNDKQIACTKCGALNDFRCIKCNSKVLWRNHLLTDFLIGAHAQNHANVLLTRDRGYYKKYFTVRILP